MTHSPRNTTISIRVRDDMLAHLRDLARREAVERGEDISYADLIREALERMHPEEEWHIQGIQKSS
jgi:Arc/MetJ-type ribon-helix-helix transcriptional regulator